MSNSPTAELPAVPELASSGETATATRGEKARSRWGRLWQLMGLAAFLGAALLLLALRPTALGGSHAYIAVAGDSMEPKLHQGDLVVTKRQDTYRNGDIVAFRIPDGHVGEGKLVIHRVIGGSAATGFITQGDNRDSPDLWRPKPSDVEGELRVHVAGSGALLLHLRTPLGFALAVAMLTFVILVFPSRADERD